MADQVLNSEIEHSYVDETARIIRNRLPYSTLGLVFSFAVAWLFEHQTHPERDLIYGIIFVLELAACGIAIFLTRRRTLRARRPTGRWRS